MTDTQEAMREFEQWFEENFEPHDRATTYGYSALEECWQAATAQSAEKIADLNAIIGVQHTKLVASEEKIARLECQQAQAEKIAATSNKKETENDYT